MTVTIAEVPYSSAGVGRNDAEDLVNERFALAGDLAVEQVDASQVYLDALSALFSSVTMPESDIDYDFQNISLDSDITSSRPEAPSDADLTPGDVAVPVMETLNTISIPTITIPEYTLVAPTDELSYDETIYQSDLQVALKAALETFIADGGTGLGADVEAALWARAQAKQDILNERTYDEANEFYASKGYTIPPGALGGRLTEALAEQTRANAQLLYEIYIEQARLARAQSEHTMTASIALEGQDKELFNNIANRSLEAAKATIQVIVDLYDVKVKEYIAKLEGNKLIIEAEKIKVDAAVAANKSITDTYAVDVEAYKVKITMELGIVEMVAKVYGYKIAGYEADARVAATELDAQIKVYQGNIDQANNQTSISLKEAELAIQSYLGSLQLTSDAIKTGGNISAQIAASALSAVNASASLGDSSSRAWNVGHSYGYSLNNSANLSESHTYDETKV